MSISNDCIFIGTYDHLDHSQLKLLQSNEHVVWIKVGENSKFRCRALPETIAFCQTLLKKYKGDGLPTSMAMNTKERLLINHLNTFIESMHTKSDLLS